jgi:hypothetical protein
MLLVRGFSRMLTVPSAGARSRSDSIAASVRSTSNCALLR